MQTLRETTISAISNSSSRDYNSNSKTRNPFDVVILDYKMPRKDGMQVAKEIQTANPSQRMIFASAFVKETLIEAIKELKHPVELMQKPFGPKALADRVEDRNAYYQLKKLFAKVKRINENDFENPDQEQIKDILECLMEIQKQDRF